METAIKLKKQKVSLGLRINGVDNNLAKGVIVFTLMLIPLLLMFFAPVIVYQDGRAAIEEGFSVVRLLGLLIGGNMTAPYFDVEAQAYIDITLPVMPAVTMVVLALIVLAFTVAIFVTAILRRKNYRFLGLPIMAYALLALGLFLFFAIAKIPIESERANSKYYYHEFETGVSVLLAGVFMLLCGGVQFALKPKLIKKVKRFWFIYLVLIVPTACMLVFSYFPIFLQSIISFKDYKTAFGIWGSEWVGLKYFKEIFTSPEMGRVIWNSVKLSLYRIFFSIVPPLFLAIFLFDMGHNKLRKGIQTIVYIPHFFSWVIIYAIYYAFMSNTGLVTNIMQKLTGDPNFHGNYMTNPNLIVPVLMITLVWKEVGWGTILYLAALSNVDPTLYEAAAIDGAGPMKKLFHVTLPSIYPIIIFTFIMAIGSLFNNSIDQIMLFSNVAVQDKVYTIEYWVYKNGIGKNQFGLGAAVGFVQSAIGLVLVLVCNKVAIKVTGRGVW